MKAKTFISFLKFLRKGKSTRDNHFYRQIETTEKIVFMYPKEERAIKTAKIIAMYN